MSMYGYCWSCGTPVVTRTRGVPSYDTCEQGHTNLASLTLTEEQRRALHDPDERVRAELEVLLIPIIQEQSQGEWDDKAIAEDAAMIADRLTQPVCVMIRNAKKE